MIRHECLELLAGKMTDQLVVTSQSGQRIEWSHLSKHEGNLLVGMMGCAIGVGMGLALALPHRKVIVLDSDGSVLLSLFNLATLGNLRPKNLNIFVFDNGVYSGSRISYPTATAGNTDLEAMARGAGIKKSAHDSGYRNVQERRTKSVGAKRIGFLRLQSRRKSHAPGNSPSEHRPRGEQVHLREISGANGRENDSVYRCGRPLKDQCSCLSEGVTSCVIAIASA